MKEKKKPKLVPGMSGGKSYKTYMSVESLNTYLTMMGNEYRKSTYNIKITFIF